MTGKNRPKHRTSCIAIELENKTVSEAKLEALAQSAIGHINTLAYTRLFSLFAFREHDLGLHIQHATNTIATLHMLKSCIDGCKCLAMGNVFINLHVASNIVVHEAGQLGATFDATKSTTLPHTPGHKLECCFLCQPPFVLAQAKEKKNSHLRLVEISWPAAATPMIML